MHNNLAYHTKPLNIYRSAHQGERLDPLKHPNGVQHSERVVLLSTVNAFPIVAREEGLATGVFPYAAAGDGNAEVAS